MKFRVSINALRFAGEISPYRFTSVALLIGAFTAAVQILSAETYDKYLITAATCFAVAIPLLTACAYHYIYAEVRGFKIDHSLLTLLWLFGIIATIAGFTAAFSHIRQLVGITFLIAAAIAFFVAHMLEDPIIAGISSKLRKSDQDNTGEQKNEVIPN